MSGFREGGHQVPEEPRCAAPGEVGDHGRRREGDCDHCTPGGSQGASHLPSNIQHTLYPHCRSLLSVRLSTMLILLVSFCDSRNTTTLGSFVTSFCFTVAMAWLVAVVEWELCRVVSVVHRVWPRHEGSGPPPQPRPYHGIPGLCWPRPPAVGLPGSGQGIGGTARYRPAH